MDLKVIGTSNINSFAANQKRQYSGDSVYSKSINSPIDKSSDGIFSYSEAAKNFAKGFVSPVTSMFTSINGFLTGAGMIAGSTALVIATGGAAAPILVSAGVILGTVQVANAARKIAHAKNGDDVEKAFYDIGGATSTIGLSVAGAKASLKNAGIQTEGLNAFSAVTKCFTELPSMLSECGNVFKNGFFKINISSFRKSLSENKVTRAISEEIHRDGITKYEEAVGQIREILPEELRGNFFGRLKSRRSIYDKLTSGARSNEKINNIQNNPNISPEQKAEMISHLQAQQDSLLVDKTSATKAVDDLVGTRLVLDEIDDVKIQRLVDSLAEAIHSGKIKILEIKNYKGPGANARFYFSRPQVGTIQEAAFERNMSIKVRDLTKDVGIEASPEAASKSRNGRIKSSGYSAVQIKIRHNNGALGELQIRGSFIDEVANWEHIPYDLRMSKDIFLGNNRRGNLLLPVQKAIKSLSKEEFIRYQRYIAEVYEYARNQELGIASKEPEFKGFDNILSAESLKALHSQLQNLPQVTEKSFAFVPQTTLYSVAAQYISPDNQNFVN